MNSKLFETFFSLLKTIPGLPYAKLVSRQEELTEAFENLLRSPNN